MEIVLARHGRPKLRQWSWITPGQFAEWIRAYDQAGIFVEEVPPHIRAKAVQSPWIVSSPLPRCEQSAQALAPLRQIDKEELFREAGLPHAFWRFPRLPSSVWTVIFRAAWFCGYSTNSESLVMARNRARSAALRLIDLAREHQSVFLVGHGIINTLIAKELIRQGWMGPSRPAHRHWRFSVYRHDI
jgi:broad specificity phosphatase PhoE